MVFFLGLYFVRSVGFLLGWFLAWLFGWLLGWFLACLFVCLVGGLVVVGWLFALVVFLPSKLFHPRSMREVTAVKTRTSRCERETAGSTRNPKKESQTIHVRYQHLTQIGDYMWVCSNIYIYMSCLRGLLGVLATTPGTTPSIISSGRSSDSDGFAKATEGSTLLADAQRALLFYALFGEGSPTKIDYRKKRYPYSNLFTGGPSQTWAKFARTEAI